MKRRPKPSRQRARPEPGGRKMRGVYLGESLYRQACAKAGKLTFSAYVERLIVRDLAPSRPMRPFDEEESE